MGVGDKVERGWQKTKDKKKWTLDPLLLFLFASFVCSYSMEE